MLLRVPFPRCDPSSEIAEVERPIPVSLWDGRFRVRRPATERAQSIDAKRLAKVWTSPGHRAEK
jgi:hypothetical protein